MLLTETIQNCASAIRKRRTMQEEKQSVDSYKKAIHQLNQASSSLRRTLLCVAQMEKNGIVDRPLINAETRSSLMENLMQCSAGIDDMDLSADKVRVLQTICSTYAENVQIFWRSEAKRYSDGQKGYLSIIAGITDNPQRALRLINQIDAAIGGEMTVEKISRLTGLVADAKSITSAYSMNHDLEQFLIKVSEKRATVADLSPTVLTWLAQNHVDKKLRISF